MVWRTDHGYVSAAFGLARQREAAGDRVGAVAALDQIPSASSHLTDAGAAAIEIGRRLAALSRSAQVIVVTHLAQVAAFATNHLRVLKDGDGSVTASSVQQLSGDERAAEMARLLSGLPDSAAALEHARELLGLAGSRD